MIRLDDIYNERNVHAFLYQLLAEREPHVNISHREMPSFEAHCAFVHSRPYRNWWLIIRETPSGSVRTGACYLSKQNEIGVQVAKQFQRQGIAKEAVRQIMETAPGSQLLANVAPGNEASASLFASLGFEICQHTYRLRRDG